MENVKITSLDEKLRFWLMQIFVKEYLMKESRKIGEKYLCIMDSTPRMILRKMSHDWYENKLFYGSANASDSNKQCSVTFVKTDKLRLIWSFSFYVSSKWSF